LEAQAHALLIRSEPTAGAILAREPPVIHLWFSEDLNSSLSRAVVWDRYRRQVDLRNDTVSHARELTVSLRPHLPDGSYLVLWTSVSAQDGHVLKGAFLFSIGHPGPAPPAPSLGGTGTQSFPPDLQGLVSILSRSAELATAALWLGLAIFLAIVIPSASPSARRLASAAGSLASRLLPFALLALLVARTVYIVIQANTLAGGDWSATFSATTFRGLLLQTEYGHLWIALQLLALGALVISVARLAFIHPPGATEPLRSVGSAPMPSIRGSQLRGAEGETIFGLALLVPVGPLASGTALLVLLALAESFLMAASGHAATVNLYHTGTGILTWPVVIDWLHLVATGIWVGGIFTVSLVLLPALKASGQAHLVPFLDTLDRFSPFAYASVVVLTLSGGFNGKFHVPSWDAFFNSVYGRTLVVKIVLVGLMIMISAFTVGIVRPKLRSLLNGPPIEATRRTIGYLRAILAQWLRVGAVLGFFVFVATAVLNAYPVPLTFGAVAGPFAMTGHNDSLQAVLKLSPGKAGPNAFTVLLRRNGRPVPLADVRIIETMLDMNMGTQFLVLNQKAPGVFKGQGEVAMGGHWDFEVIVRLPNATTLTDIFFRPTIAA
jgi:copper transport protein